MKITDNSTRLIAIGDIHGCDKILQTVLSSIEPKRDDTFIFLGDLCNRGPNTKGVFDLIFDLEKTSDVHFVMGNHEEMVVAALMGSSDHNFWCKFGGLQMLQSFGVEKANQIPRRYLNTIVNMRDYIETDDFIFIHASYDPSLAMETQEGQVLRWEKNRGSLKHNSGKRVVCGHTPQKEVLVTDAYICLDTGCGVQPPSRLTALDLKSGTLWQATSRSKTAKITKILF